MMVHVQMQKQHSLSLDSFISLTCLTLKKQFDEKNIKVKIKKQINVGKKKSIDSLFI